MVRRSRNRLRRQRSVGRQVPLIILFFVVLPLTAVFIGLRVTEFWVVPTINTEAILGGDEENDPLEQEGIGETQDNSGENSSPVDSEEKSEQVSADEKTSKVLELEPLSVYMVQIASVSDNKNIEGLIGQLNDYELPHLIYKMDNSFKVYTWGFTKRAYVEEKVEQVKELYSDAYISEMHIPRKEIKYSDSGNKGMEEIIEGLNELIQLFNKFSDNWYKFVKEEGDLYSYKELVINHQNLLKKLSENLSKAELPESLLNKNDIEKMIHYQESNINKSIELIESEKEIYRLHSLFLDSLFRTIEVIKR